MTTGFLWYPTYDNLLKSLRSPYLLQQHPIFSRLTLQDVSLRKCKCCNPYLLILSGGNSFVVTLQPSVWPDWQILLLSSSGYADLTAYVITDFQMKLVKLRVAKTYSLFFPSDGDWVATIYKTYTIWPTAYSLALTNIMSSWFTLVDSVEEKDFLSLPIFYRLSMTLTDPSLAQIFTLCICQCTKLGTTQAILGYQG